MGGSCPPTLLAHYCCMLACAAACVIACAAACATACATACAAACATACAAALYCMSCCMCCMCCCMHVLLHVLHVLLLLGRYNNIMPVHSLPTIIVATAGSPFLLQLMAVECICMHACCCYGDD